MSYQFFNPAPVFFDLLSLEPLAGGSITFYAKGTTDLQDTWSNDELTVLNPNPVDLDSSGRCNTQVWLDGEYSIVIRSAAGETVATRDVTSGQSAGASIPALTNGFLTNDGTSMFWQTLREVPDPTGMPNRILSTDGTNLLWIEQPEIPEPEKPDIVVAAKSFRAGNSEDSTKFFLQTGTGSAPASGSNTTQVPVTFDTAFAAVPTVMVSPTVAQGGSSGYLPADSIIAKSATGFTVKFDTNSGQDSGGRINSPIAFDYVAFGTVTVAPAA